MIVKAGLAATGDYKEKVLFHDWFPDEDETGESRGDADTEFDYSDVDFGVPQQDEMEMLAAMLADNSVTVDGGPLEGPDAVQVPRSDEDDLPAIPPPRDFDPGDVEQDMEWT